ncbi:UNVERIFIED_CONTAM: hypothetical protein K2H54_017139 [Gekko kuhli]
MGSMLTKNSPGLVIWRDQIAERGRNRGSHRRRAGGTSSDETQAEIKTHRVEADMCRITQNKNEAHVMVTSNMMGPPKTSPEGAETQSLPDDWKVSGEMDLELGPEKAVGAVEDDPVVQRQVHDGSSGKVLGVAETHSTLPSADTSDSPGSREFKEQRK